jgi:peptidoglycan hydrolase CwlO-like protein
VERLREEIQTTDAKINKLRMELKKLENEIKDLEKYNGRSI